MKKILMILTVCLCVVPSIVWAEGENTPAEQDKKEEKSITNNLTEEKRNSLAEVTHNILQKNFNIVSPPYVYKDLDPFHLETRYTNLEELSLDTDDPLFRSQYNRTVDIKKLCKAKKGDSANDGKHDPDCAFISKDFGICDTHAYNAGFYSNPTTAEEKERMREIIAAKITVISQQMYKQYEYLNATLTRLEKQLQKAVTTAELEMASGKSDSDSSSYSSSSSKETPLAGSENCMYAGGGLKTYECLNRNLMLIQSNIETNRSQAKKQLEKDYGIAKTFGIDACYAYEGDTLSTCQKVDEKGSEATAGKDYLPCHTDNLKTKDGIKKCANKLTMAVQRAMDKENKDLLQYSNRRY